MNSSNTTYFTGYAFKYCDTCQNGSLIYRYAKEFLGFNLEDDIVNNQYNLGNNVVKQHSQVNDSWAFNVNLTALTISKTEVLILGVLDSIKTIELTNSDTIIISKNYGIIRYPDFENSGKYFEFVGYHEGQNSYGEYLPNFWRTYDFNVGDVLSYDMQISSFWCTTNYTASVKIIENLSTGDTIRFLARTIYYHTTSPNDESGCDYTSQPHNYLDTILVINDKRRYENLYGMQYIDTTLSAMNNAYPIMHYDYMNSETIAASHFEHPIFGTTKRIHHFIPEGDSLLLEIGYSHNKYFSNYYGMILLYPLEALNEIYISELVGAIINGDTTGTIYNYPDDLGYEEQITKKQLNIYPNPATNQITVETDINNLKIYSNLGQLVMEINHPNEVIDVSKLPKGLYFIIASDFENNILTSKLIIE